MSAQQWIGRSLGGRYLVEEVLGQGGMSSVFKARDPNLRRTIAVKLIHPHLSEDPQFVSRFEEEAAAVASLKHPNIIQVYDFDHDQDTYYMVLEYVPGETLREYQARIVREKGSIDPERVRQITAQVCDALEYAHQRDMIHRDIKPANIMINEQGQAILMDFGVAKIVGGKQHTATGVVVGTANYLSPEQIKGEDIDRRVDLYAVGIMLYEMLSGRPPYDAESAATIMMKHVNNPIPDIRRTNPDVPQDLVAIIEKALQKNRENRFSSAGEMAQALRSPGSLQMGDLSPAVGATTVEPASERAEPDTVAPAYPATPQAAHQDRPAAPPPGPPAPPPSEAPRGARPGGRRGLLAGGAAVLILVGCLVVGGLAFLAYQQFGGAIPALDDPSPTATATQTATLPPPTPTDTEAPPTDTPEPTITPSPSPPPEPFVLIEDITLSGSTYLVEYETFGYTEVLPGMHIHFFWDTVPVSQAGSPGSGPWFLWGGPRPFNGYSVSDRPPGATQMCALVANPNHSIQPNTGNCFDLPG